MPVLKASNYQTPPVRPPSPPQGNSSPRSGSPERQSASHDVLATGNELIVHGLDRSTPTSAGEDFSRRIEPLLQQGALPSLQIRPADSRHPLDYIYIALVPPLDNPPRRDILNDVRKTLIQHFPDLVTRWRSSRHYDRTRMVYFTPSKDCGMTLSQIMERLDNIFKSSGHVVQHRWMSDNTGRITYNFTSLESVKALKKDPPVLKDGPPLHPHQYRVVEPITAFEVGIINVQDYSNARSIIDDYIRAEYGPDALVSSRMEMDGDVYCAVMKDWDLTCRIMKDEFRAFSAGPLAGFLTVNAFPTLLFVLNNNGVPSTHTGRSNQWNAESAQENRLLRAQLQGMEKKIEDVNALYVRMMEEQHRVIEHVNAQVNRVLESLTNVFLFSTAQANLATARSRLDNLESSRQSLEFTLAIASEEQRSLLRPQLALLGPRIESARRDVAEAHHHLTQVTPSGLAPPPPLLPSATHPQMAFPPPGLPHPAAPAASSSQLQPSSSRPRSASASPPAPLGDHDISMREGSLTPVPQDDDEDMDEEDHLTLLSSSPTQGRNPKVPRLDKGKDPDRTPATRRTTNKVLPPPSFTVHTSECAPLEPKIVKGDTAALPRVACDAHDVQYHKRHVPIPSRFSSLCILLLFALSFCATTVTATTAQPFMGLSLNTNGLGDYAQHRLISDAISDINPHIIALSETKAHHPVASRLRLTNYNTHETTGVKTSNRKSSKWGVILAIRRDVHSEPVCLDKEILRGRVSVADLHLPGSDGRSIRHRIVAAYAPWDPGTGEVSTFWDEISSICAAAPGGLWSLYGDCNVTLSSSEHLSNSPHRPENCQAYSQFLLRCGGVDLWSSRPDRDARTHYTYKGAFGQSIIDRVACAAHSILSSDINVVHRFMGSTDHRAVVSRLFLAANPALQHQFSPLSSYTPRFRYPRKGESSRSRLFSQEVRKKVMDNPILASQIDDDASFNAAYSTFSDILSASASLSFLKPSPPSHQNGRQVTSPAIRNIMREWKRVNRLIFAAKRPDAQDSFPVFCIRNQWAIPYASSFNQTLGDAVSSQYAPHLVRDILPSFLTHLQTVRSSLAKLRYREEKAVLRHRASQTSRNLVNSVLLGGSAKRLFPSSFSSPPLVISKTSDPNTFVSDPEQVKDEMVTYFSALFRRESRPPHPKPWLSTPSIVTIRNRTSRDPFSWPRLMTVEDLRFMLRRGASKPAPGPDGWEKWWFKALDDDALRPFLNMLNYIIANSHFPNIIKPTYLSVIHKRGTRTSMSNYRGVCCSNFISQMACGWLTYNLTMYLSKHEVIPRTQVATQPGVQGRDLLSFLSQLHTWSSRNKQPLYVLQRDQMKGFDMLEPDGFYDAITAYGLPQSIIEFDRSSQAGVLYRVKSAYGFTDPFVVNGLTRQGGPGSPLKFTLTSSLGNYWLRDCLSTDPGAVVVSTMNARAGIFHEPSDNIRLQVPMVEAMDDSYITSCSLGTCRRSCFIMEQFQACYGARTRWDKSYLYVLNTPCTTPKVRLPTVDPSHPFNDSIVPMADVVVVRDQLEFLRTEINNPSKQYLSLRDLITDFQFPVLSSRLPFTALRRIISQCLISKIRPRLSFQPIKPADAETLDKMIATKVHSYLGFPFSPSSRLMYLPLNSGGFDFPSVAHLNIEATICGLLRDLNHHIPAFRDMARITLTDWSCARNFCATPFYGPPLLNDFRRLSGAASPHFPFAWISAHLLMRNLGLSLPTMDQSHILRGDVSLSHLHRYFNLHPSSLPSVSRSIIPTYNDIESLSRAGIHRLSDCARWVADSPSSSTPEYKITFPAPFQLIFHDNRPILNSWLRVRSFLSSLSLSDFTHHHHHLAIPRNIRQSTSETHILSMLSSSANLFSSSSPDNIPRQIIASDASLLPPSPSILQPRSITFSALHNNKSFVFSIPRSQTSFSILHGELYGLILAALLYKSSPSHFEDSIIYSDHLNAIRFINNALRNKPLPSVIFSVPARSLYRWLLHIIEHLPTKPSFSHVRSHTNNLDAPSIANDAVDKHATRSQHLSLLPPAAPIPTFLMDDFVLHHHLTGYIEWPVQATIKSLHHQHISSDSSFKPHMRLAKFLYDNNPIPTHPYTRSSSAFAATTQLYARSGQLATRSITSTRFGDTLPICSFGCTAVETPHHIFVECRRFDKIRESFSSRSINNISLLCDRADAPPEWRSAFERLVTSLFSDGDPWPLRRSRYYLGLIPPIRPLVDNHVDWPSIKRDRFICSVAQSFHVSAIHLTARIWGYICRLRSPRLNVCTNIQNISVPSHLSSLLPASERPLSIDS
ncbi:hypothetical protein PM082_018430 [Marasmius tenuissimus]|nr:hypothetical protein PM082_018430 [Marasmius tenuissimus]